MCVCVCVCVCDLCLLSPVRLVMQEHPWFGGIDWVKLRRGELKPVFLPRMNGNTDTRYFDTEFTRMPVSDELGQSAPTNGADPAFPDFTFMTPSELSSRMRRSSYLGTSIGASGTPPGGHMAAGGAGAGAGSSGAVAAPAGFAGAGHQAAATNAVPLQGSMAAGGWPATSAAGPSYGYK